MCRRRRRSSWSSPRARSSRSGNLFRVGIEVYKGNLQDCGIGGGRDLEETASSSSSSSSEIPAILDGWWHGREREEVSTGSRGAEAVVPEEEEYVEEGKLSFNEPAWDTPCKASRRGNEKDGTPVPRPGFVVKSTGSEDRQ